jgi:hypothetical protein
LLVVGGRPYVLQASTNLGQWTDLATNTAASGTLTTTNGLDPTFPQRFFWLKSP